MEKLAASSEIRKEELVSNTTAFAIFMLNFVEKKRRNRVSLNYNNKKKMSRREANEGAPLQTLDVRIIASNNQRLKSAGDNDRRSKRFCFLCFE